MNAESNSGIGSIISKMMLDIIKILPKKFGQVPIPGM